MNRTILLSPLIVGALAVAGCADGGYYSGSVGYSNGAPPPPPPGPAGYVQPVPQAPPPEASYAGGDQIDVNVFYNDLAPYGRWVVSAQYGRVFVPANVGPDWRPYTVGRWEYTDYGWTWVSDEPFGWATCHYGGWAMVAPYGWVWVPGTTWGPAWVAWREGDGYVGWAPLPPHHGVDIHVSIGNAIPASHYTFVDERYVTAPEIRQHVVNVQRNTTIINKTTNITNVKVVNNKVVNNSLNVQRVERVTGKRIQPKVVRTVETPTKAAVRGNAVEVYRPKVRAAAKTAPPAAQTAPPAARTPSAAERQRLEQERLAKERAAARVQTPAASAAERQRLEQERLAKERAAARAQTPGAAAANTRAYELERQRLAQEHAKQRQELEQRQLKERQNRPGNITPQELQRRHEIQAKNLEAKQKQELQQLRQKHKQP